MSTDQNPSTPSSGAEAPPRAAQDAAPQAAGSGASSESERALGRRHSHRSVPARGSGRPGEPETEQLAGPGTSGTSWTGDPDRPPSGGRARQASPRGQIDSRGPRFGAWITSFLLAVDIVLALVGLRWTALILLGVIAVIFALGATGSAAHPWNALFRRVVRPRLAPPKETEDPAPPRFAQLVGLVITGIGLVLGIVGVTPAVPIAAGLAFIAAFLNALVGLCLGCELYGLLVRAGAIRRSAAA